MFGLKIVKKVDYDSYQEQLRLDSELLCKKCEVITELQRDIDKYRKQLLKKDEKIKDLESKVIALEERTYELQKDKPELLVDVAEAPLVVEKKKTSKPRKKKVE